MNYPESKKNCLHCNGTGFLPDSGILTYQRQYCTYCHGSGEIDPYYIKKLARRMDKIYKPR